MPQYHEMNGYTPLPADKGYWPWLSDHGILFGFLLTAAGGLGILFFTCLRKHGHVPFDFLHFLLHQSQHAFSALMAFCSPCLRFFIEFMQLGVIFSFVTAVCKVAKHGVLRFAGLQLFSMSSDDADSMLNTFPNVIGLLLVMVGFVYLLEVPANDKWPNLSDAAPLRTTIAAGNKVCDFVTNLCTWLQQKLYGRSHPPVDDARAQCELTDKEIANESLQRVRASLATFSKIHPSSYNQQSTAIGRELATQNTIKTDAGTPSTPAGPPVPIENDFDGSTAQWTDQPHKNERSDSLVVNASTSPLPERNAWQDITCDNDDQKEEVGETY